MKSVNGTMSDDQVLGRLEVALSPRQRFEEYLQSRSMRMTQQRRFLIDHVFRRHEHFDADTLIEQMPSSGEEGHVSRPTVYRTLSELVDAGLLRKLQLDGRAVYEHDYGYPQHDHLHCNECGKLIEFSSDEIVGLREKVAGKYQFHVTAHRLIITGICEDCYQGKRRQRQKVNCQKVDFDGSAERNRNG